MLFDVFFDAGVSVGTCGAQRDWASNTVLNMPRHLMVRVFLIVCPRVPTNDGVGLDQADQKDEPADHLVQGHIAHAVVVVVQIEVVLAAQDARDLGIVALVAKHVVADRPLRAKPRSIAHIIIGRADEIARVAFLNPLDHRSRRHQRNIVRMSLECEKHFSFVRLFRCRPLDENLASAGRPLLLSARQAHRHGAGCHAAEEIATQHAVDYTLLKHFRTYVGVGLKIIQALRKARPRRVGESVSSSASSEPPCIELVSESLSCGNKVAWRGGSDGNRSIPYW